MFRYRKILPEPIPEKTVKRFSEDWILKKARDLDLNYSQFSVIDEVSRFSSLLPNHIEQVRQTFKRVMSGFQPLEQLTVIDATAHIGADSIVILSQLGKLVGAKTTRVFAIEVSPQVFRALEENCNNYLKINPQGDESVTFYPRFGSCLSELSYLPNADVLYFDPPWGGTDYASVQNLVLKLGPFSVAQVIRVYLKSSPNTVVVCKQPKNFDENEFTSTLQGCSIETHIVFKGKREVSYYLLEIRKSKQSTDLFTFEGVLAERWERFIRKNTNPVKNSDKILRVCSSNISDLDKLKHSRLFTSQREQFSSKGRTDSRVEQLLEFVSVKPSNYLDVGCSEGSITFAFGKAIDSAKISACDISQKAGTSLPKDVDFRINTERSLPFDDDCFDLVTLNMSAHHFTFLEDMLKEIRRVMTPRGILILREHGNPSHARFYDAVHAFYECVFGDESTPKQWIQSYQPGTYAHYRSQEDWISIIESFDFKLVKTKVIKDFVDTFYASFER